MGAFYDYLSTGCVKTPDGLLNELLSKTKSKHFIDTIGCMSIHLSHYCLNATLGSDHHVVQYTPAVTIERLS